MSNLLELQNLHVSYHTPRGTVQAVRGVDLTLQPGEVLAIVGESGCGKSALCKAIMRLLPDNAGIEGKILVNGTDIAPYPEKELQKLRGRRMRRCAGRIIRHAARKTRVLRRRRWGRRTMSGSSGACSSVSAFCRRRCARGA